MFCSKLNDESGIALIVSLIVVMLGTILAGSYMSVVVYESRHSVWQKRRSQSLFMAEAGIEQALYYLNNTDDPDNPWADETGQIYATPLYTDGDLAGGNYNLALYDQNDKPWLPMDAYLVETTADLSSTNDVERRLSCIAVKLEGVPIPAALSIMDGADVEDEMLNFQSAVWTIDGRDHDFAGNLIMVGNNGLPGIAVANDGDDLPYQLDKHPDKPKRLDQVMGLRDMDEDGTLDFVDGMDAILEDLSLPTDLDAYAEYFKRIAIDISSVGDIPGHALGGADNFQVLHADLSEGDIMVAGHSTGYGVIILEGDGEFTMSGNSVWNGIIICAGDSQIRLTGGGAVPAHINGALLIANGTVNMGGNADVKYSSETIGEINKHLLLYQVYSWCGGWGQALGSDEYYPVTDETYPDGF